MVLRRFGRGLFVLVMGYFVGAKEPVKMGGIDIIDAPAPKEDRVGLPKSYTTEFKVIRVSERAGNKTVALVYGNQQAAERSSPDAPFAYGSVLLSEIWDTDKDAQGNVMLDGSGRFRRTKVIALHVMRKEHGFGESYANNRSGEWEYVMYDPKGGFLVPPENTAACAACHREKAGQSRDFVFGQR